MKHYRQLFSLMIMFFLVSSFADPSWAWRGGWGWRGGGPRVGVYLGGGPYGWYDPYYAEPYGYPYYPYSYPDPYAYPPPYNGYPAPTYATPQATSQASQPPAPDTTRYDLRFIKAQIAKAREAVNFEYSDGDLTKEQRDQALNNINDVEKEARAEAAAGGGMITGDQEKALQAQLRGGPPPSATAYQNESAEPQENLRPNLPNMTAPQGEAPTAPAMPRHDLKLVKEKLANVRALLDKKVAAGDITPAQRESEAAYLTQIEKIAQAQAAAQNGMLTSDQEEAFLQELLHADYIINQNFVAR